MSVDGWNTILVLGGIRSGKSEFAESLVADAPMVRYVATAGERRPGGHRVGDPARGAPRPPAGQLDHRGDRARIRAGWPT